MFSKSPFYRVPGPGVTPSKSVSTKMDLHFLTPTVRGEARQAMQAPQLGVKSVYDTKPWVKSGYIANLEQQTEDDLRDEIKEHQNVSNEHRMSSNTVSDGDMFNNTINVDDEGFKRRKLLDEQETSREELVRRVKAVLRARQILRAKEAMKRKQEELETNLRDKIREKQEAKEEEKLIEKKDLNRQDIVTRKPLANKRKKKFKKKRFSKKSSKFVKPFKSQPHQRRKPQLQSRSQTKTKSQSKTQGKPKQSVSHLVESVAPTLKELVRLPRHMRAPHTDTHTTTATALPHVVERGEELVQSRITKADTIYLQDFN